MPHLNFGQPDKGIMQMAYVVPDLRAAMDEWVRRLNVGPWFVLDHFTPASIRSTAAGHRRPISRWRCPSPAT
ncbi:MAG: hypothetical protein WDM81_17900 [Rhizomicrobium sp.]